MNLRMIIFHKKMVQVSKLFLFYFLQLLIFMNISFAQPNANISFEERNKDLPGIDKNMRKWDAPIVADLDQDGYVDLILNDHGYSVFICWNNQGKFAKPYDVIMGDMHGISVGDFNLDGRMEFIISRGGGAGSNARNAKVFQVDKKRNFSEINNFNPPLMYMRGRTVKFLDADNDGDLDLLDFAFPSAEKKGKSENYIYENKGSGQLFVVSLLPPVKANGQKTLVTDFNNDGVLDLLLYGNGPVKAYQGRGDLTYTEVTDKIFPYKIENVTSIVEMDYDNDGDFDLYFTRGKDFEIGETFYDSESQTWGFFSKRGKFEPQDLIVGDVLEIENFHTQWPHKNIYLGESGYKYEFPGETHSGKDLRIVNSDALGFPDVLTNRGTYIGFVGNRAWRLVTDTWGPITAVVHGVKEYPAYNHSKGLSDVLLKNNGEKFVDATKKAELFFEEHTKCAAVADLDNNGWQDLVVVPRGDLIHHNKLIVFLNTGKSTFKRVTEHKLVSSELGAIGLGVETLDYDKDGKVDILVGNERGKWHLFKNLMESSPESQYLIVKVGYSKSGKASALGALVKVSSCYGTQTRRIGSTGAAYSQGCNQFVHFGLGKCTKPVKVKVTWTNGESEERTIHSFNQMVEFGSKM